MSMKQTTTGLLSGLFLLGMVGQAQAIPVTYNVNGIFDDGGTLNGTVDIDTDPAVANAARIGDVSLTVSDNGVFTMLTYTQVSSVVTNDNDVTRLSITSGAALPAGAILRELVLNWAPELNGGGTGPFAFDLNAPASRERFRIPGQPNPSRILVSGSAVATPEPGTILLFGSGLLGLGLWRYRKTQNS